MKEPDPQLEKKILLTVVEQMSDLESTARKQDTLRKGLLGGGSTVLLVAFILAIGGVVHAFTSAFLAAMAGCAIGFGAFLEFAHKQWPVTRKHLDMESVRRRLNELNGGKQ